MLYVQYTQTDNTKLLPYMQLHKDIFSCNSVHYSVQCTYDPSCFCIAFQCSQFLTPLNKLLCVQEANGEITQVVHHAMSLSSYCITISCNSATSQITQVVHHAVSLSSYCITISCNSATSHGPMSSVGSIASFPGSHTPECEHWSFFVSHEKR